MSNLYQQYLAATYLERLLEDVGMKYNSLDLQVTGEIIVFMDDWYVDSTGYSFLGEEKVQAQREERERVINELLTVPGAYCDRDGNRITVYLEIHSVKVNIMIGEALCERVQTGTKTVERVDPDYLALAPKITVEEPVYEIRCSDDILGSMAHKS